MAENDVKIEYSLGDIAVISSPEFGGLKARSLRFRRYGTKLIGSKEAKASADTMTLAEARAWVEATGRPLEHIRRVYVASKYLAGQGGGIGHETRVFSTYSAVEAYLESDIDDPSPNKDDVVISMMTCALDSPYEHDPCNCLELICQEDALEALEPAVPGPQSSGKVDAQAAALEAADDALRLTLQDGRKLEVPRSWFSFLCEADDKQWRGARLDGTRQFIKWPRTPKRVAIEGLLASA